MDKNSFLIYLDYEEQFNLLTDEQIGQLMRAIIKYEKTEEVPELSGMIKMAFSFIKQQLDRDREKWKEEKQKRSNAGKKGMAKRWNDNNNDNNVITKNNNASSVINPITKITDNVNVTVNDNVNVNDNVTVNNNIGDSCVNGLQKIFNFYQDNIGLITPYGVEILTDYAKEMPEELIILAMKKSVEANKRTIQYIKGILNNWSKKGIKTVLDAEKEDERFNKRKNNSAEEEFLNEQE